MRTGRNDDDDAPPPEEEHGWANISANEVSDDDGDDEDPDPQLIVPGDESAANHTEASSNLTLSTSGMLDLSQIDISAIADSLIPQEDIVATDDKKTMTTTTTQEEMTYEGYADDDDVVKEDGEEQVARVKSFLRGSNGKAMALLLVVSTLLVIVVGSIVAGTQAWKRHSERVAFLEQEVERLQDIERKAQELNDELQQQRTSSSRGWWLHDMTDGRELADNCYFHAGLGECTKHMMAEWNEKMSNVYKSFESTMMWSWDDEDDKEECGTDGDDDAENKKDSDEDHWPSPPMAETFSEVMDAVSHSMEAAGDALSSLWNDFSTEMEESLQFVTKEFSIDRVQEFTRETLDDATAYTRPEK